MHDTPIFDLIPASSFLLRLMKLSGNIPCPVEDAEDLERLRCRLVDDGVVLMNREKPDRLVRQFSAPMAEVRALSKPLTGFENLILQSTGRDRVLRRDVRPNIEQVVLGCKRQQVRCHPR